VFIQTKIIRLDRQDNAAEIVKSISLYSNSQNKVEMAISVQTRPSIEDSRSLREGGDPLTGAFWFYERMRNAYAVQLMLEASPGLRDGGRTSTQGKGDHEDGPRKVHDGLGQTGGHGRSWKSECFNAFAQSYHVKPIKTDEAAEIEVTSDRYKEIIGKVIVYRTTHKIVKSDKEAFTSNQINIATYTVAYLSHRVASELDWKTI